MEKRISPYRLEILKNASHPNERCSQRDVFLLLISAKVLAPRSAVILGAACVLGAACILSTAFILGVTLLCGMNCSSSFSRLFAAIGPTMLIFRKVLGPRSAFTVGATCILGATFLHGMVCCSSFSFSRLFAAIGPTILILPRYVLGPRSAVIVGAASILGATCRGMG